MRPFLPFATLLGAVFLLGCQEQGSEPVGPEGPQFDKPSIEPPNDNCEMPDIRGHCHDDDEPVEDPLIAAGRALFFGEDGEDFDGNGRTCGTCHRADNNLTIDVVFINSLPATDLLFIAEFSPDQQTALGVNLPPFETGDDPLVPAFEAPGLMRDRGLILENIGGFDLDGSGDLITPPVFRAPPSLFNLSGTAPYGYSGNVPTLRDFVVGAIEQHFTKTLARCAAPCEGGASPDFRLPTTFELDALEAFMLSLQSPADGNFKVSGPNSILSTAEDPRAQDINRAEVAGRDLFFSVGCTSCHRRQSNRVFSGGNRDTGVEEFDKANSAPPTPTTDLGIGGRFQTPGLFGLRKAAFFHNNAVVGLQAAVAFYISTEFKESPTGGQVGFMSAADIQKITAFLEAIKCQPGTVPPDCLPG